MAKRIAKVSSSVLSREVQGEAVLLHLDSGEYFGLDPVATRIWQLIGEKGDLEAVEEALADEYDVDPSVAAADLRRILDELLQKRLIEIEQGS